MDIHVMEGTKTGDIVTHRVAFNIPVPNAVNAVDVNYRDIIARYFDTASEVPTVRSAILSSWL
jgi:hypothetical protein